MVVACSSGYSVSISGDRMIVGARYEENLEGAAYSFERVEGVWSQTGLLKASNKGGSDIFGGSVAVSGSTYVVGAIGEDSNATGVNGANNNLSSGSGAAYVYENPLPTNLCKRLIALGWLVGTEANCCPNNGRPGPNSAGSCVVAYPASAY